MTTKRKHKFTAAATMTATASELAYHRARINEIAGKAKTAVRIDENGRRVVVKRKR